jgi:hypothetical protein
LESNYLDYKTNENDFFNKVNKKKEENISPNVGKNRTEINFARFKCIGEENNRQDNGSIICGKNNTKSPNENDVQLETDYIKTTDYREALISAKTGEECETEFHEDMYRKESDRVLLPLTEYTLTIHPKINKNAAITSNSYPNLNILDQKRTKSTINEKPDNLLLQLSSLSNENLLLLQAKIRELTGKRAEAERTDAGGIFREESKWYNKETNIDEFIRKVLNEKNEDEKNKFQPELYFLKEILSYETRMPNDIEVKSLFLRFKFSEFLVSFFCFLCKRNTFINF